jgi:hypothetical protein
MKANMCIQKSILAVVLIFCLVFNAFAQRSVSLSIFGGIPRLGSKQQKSFVNGVNGTYASSVQDKATYLGSSYCFGIGYMSKEDGGFYYDASLAICKTSSKLTTTNACYERIIRHNAFRVMVFGLILNYAAYSKQNISYF